MLFLAPNSDQSFDRLLCQVSEPRFNALCGYPLVKMELDIQTRFLPRLPFSCNSIISDKIWRKMSLSLSIFLVLPQISLVKYYETIKILMQIF